MPVTHRARRQGHRYQRGNLAHNKAGHGQKNESATKSLRRGSVVVARGKRFGGHMTEANKVPVYNSQTTLLRNAFSMGAHGSREITPFSFFERSEGS